MTKYSVETKKKLIELVEQKGYSISGAAKELEVSEPLARRWYTLYTHHGYEGLVIKKHSYDGKFKVEVVEYMHKNRLSINEASAKFGIPSDATLLNWERIYYEQGAKGLLIDRRGRPRKGMHKDKNKPKKPKLSEDVERDLIAEIQYLRMENAYLKKYNALVQEKRKLREKKNRK